MTIKILNENINHGKKELIGVAADIKPTNVDAGSTFLELDGEKKIFLFDGVSWNEL